MKAFLRNLFSLESETQTDERTIEERLRLSAAALMVEVSRADHDMTDVETTRIHALLKTSLQLRDEQIDQLLSTAKEDSENATSLYQFTSLIHEHYSIAQKTTLFEHLWEVAYADGELDKYEESLLRKVADLIYLPHQHFIQSKHVVLDRHGIPHS